MILTKKFIESGSSINGGYSLKQVQLLGFDTWVHGWKKKLIGKYISDEIAAEFIRIKDDHIKNKNKKTRINDFHVDKNMPWEEQYKHPIWQRKRLIVMKKDSFRCRVCNSAEKQLHVHHLFYEGNFIWSVPDGALITVCNECHEKIHKRKFK